MHFTTHLVDKCDKKTMVVKAVTKFYFEEGNRRIMENKRNWDKFEPLYFYLSARADL